MPKFLFFSFELSDGSQNDIYQYRNLITYRDTIKKFIVANFVFNDNNYNLSGIIFMESSNHYTAYCHNCLTNQLYLSINQSFYYDDSLNLGLIQEIKEINFNDKLKKNREESIYYLIYSR